MTPANRVSLYQQFADRFRPAASGHRVVPATHGDIDTAESFVGCKFPTSYRTFVTEVGAGDSDEPDDPKFMVAEIWQPELSVRQAKEQWRAPIPAFLTAGQPIASDVAWKHLTPFASERSHGFWFCFPRLLALCDDAPVFYFNHDGGDIERVADGFDDMIHRILGGGTAAT
jgi:hypothetical protein